MQAGDPLVQHRVIGRQGQIAALVRGQRGPGGGDRGQARGRHKRSGQGTANKTAKRLEV